MIISKTDVHFCFIWTIETEGQGLLGHTPNAEASETDKDKEEHTRIELDHCLRPKTGSHVM